MRTPHGIFYGNRGRSFVLAQLVERSVTWITAPIYLEGVRRLSLAYDSNTMPTGGDNLIVTPYGKDLASTGYGSVTIGEWYPLGVGIEMQPDGVFGCMIWSDAFEDRAMEGTASVVHRQCVLPPVIRFRFDHRSGPLVGAYSATLHLT